MKLSGKKWKSENWEVPCRRIHGEKEPQVLYKLEFQPSISVLNAAEMTASNNLSHDGLKAQDEERILALQILFFFNFQQSFNFWY